jgi:hypothetical protein
MTLTPEERAAWRRLAEAATKGPWKLIQSAGITRIQPPDVDGDMALPLLWQDDDAQVDLFLAEGDWPYIAHSSPDRILALLDALEAAERRIAALCDAHEEQHVRA